MAPRERRATSAGHVHPTLPIRRGDVERRWCRIGGRYKGQLTSDESARDDREHGTKHHAEVYLTEALVEQRVIQTAEAPRLYVVTPKGWDRLFPIDPGASEEHVS